MNIEERDITTIYPYERNPRINDQAVDAIVKSIQQFGFNSPIIIDANSVIICGHTRYKAAIQMGLEKVPVVVADNLTPEQVKAYRIADNKLAELATWNYDMLIAEIESLKDSGIDLSLLEFEIVDMNQPETLKEGKTDANAVPDKPEEAVSVRGEIYQLGEHRLMCGDSTNATDVALLMNGDSAKLYLTDPPYNVAVSCVAGKTIQNDDMSSEQFLVFLKSVFDQATTVMGDDCMVYIFYASVEYVNFHRAAAAAGIDIKQELFWIKKHFVLGRHDYHYKCEACMYGWKKGAHYAWYGQRQASNLFTYKKPNVNKDHPTPKPVEMLVDLLRNSSRRGEIVLDSFGGSGSTIIACEQTGRVCRAMELDEKYCDVIRKRYAEFINGEGCDWQSFTPAIKEDSSDGE